MDAARRPWTAAVACFLVAAALVLHANHVPAAAERACKYTTPVMPFCKGWMCKAECWVEAKMFLGSAKEHRCVRGGFKGFCYCLICGNHLP